MSKERPSTFSPSEDTVSPWDELPYFSVAGDIEGATPIEEAMPVEEVASTEETSSGYDSAKREMANGDRVKEEVSEAEKLRRLRHALNIMESSYFDDLAISAEDQAFIEKMGGEDVILQEMLFDISRTYDKFQLMHIYFKDKKRLTARQQAAIEYWSEESGQTIEQYMDSEYTRFVGERDHAVDIVRRELIMHGKYDYDELSLNDASAVYDFADEELITMAEQRIYNNTRKEILPYLAGRRVGSEDSYVPDRESKYAIKYLMKKTGLTREQLERRMRNYADEIYTPSDAQREESDRFVEAHANRITDAELTRCINALGEPPLRNTTALYIAVEQLVKRKLGLERAGVPVIIKDDPNSIDDDIYGEYNTATKIITVYAGYMIKEKRSLAGEDDSILSVCDVIAHELFHAYQDSYEDKFDDKRAQMYVINDSDYISPRKNGATHDEYRRQLQEREAWKFGGIIGQRMQELYNKKRTKTL